MINIELRHPEDVMKLSRLGSFHQSKLSFLRSFIREFKNWEFNRDIFDLDKDGYGVVVYSVRKNKRIYSLICFSQHINAEERSDRVIATKWDAAFVLHDGVPTKNDIERLKENVPKQEIGRMSNKELALSRANKSVRIFDHVVNSLSSGKQPDINLLNKVGYLYRTTAVYGSGKFGLADRFRIKDRKEICGPFRLEMMLVYLVRQFTFDQINHISKMKNPNKFVNLDKKIAQNSINYLNSFSKTTNIQSLKDATSNLLESQMRSLMLAESSDEYVLKVIDSPVVPELKSAPSRATVCILITFFGGILSLVYVLSAHFYRLNG